MNSTYYSPELLGVTASGAFLIFIVGTSGNLLAVVALLQSTKLKQSPSTAFMINLPACLLPVCAIGMPLFAIGCLQQQQHGRIILPEGLTVACFTVGLILGQVHIHTICALAFNRLLAVMWPGTYKRLMQRRKVHTYLGLLWAYSALLWLPLAALGMLEYEAEELMVSIDESYGRAWKGVHVFFTYMLPILFASTCYITMYLKVRFSRRSRKVRVFRKSVLTPEDNAERQWDDHVTRTILVIFVILVLCCVPHMVVHVKHLYNHHPAAWLLLHLVFWLQFCIDPLVYVTVSRQYRAACAETAWGLLRRLGLPRSLEPHDPTISSLNVQPASVEDGMPKN